MNGEFEFNLQNLKEINVSDSFLTLDVDSRKCQHIETYNDCKTRLYIKNMKQKCGCLTLSHIMSEEVYIICTRAHKKHNWFCLKAPGALKIDLKIKVW